MAAMIDCADYLGCGIYCIRDIFIYKGHLGVKTKQAVEDVSLIGSGET